jgi:hypothetical protein
MPADDTGAAALRAAIDAVILSRHGLRAWLPPVENPPSTRGDAIRLWGNGPEVAMWAAWRDAVMLERAVSALEKPPPAGHAADRPADQSTPAAG